MRKIDNSRDAVVQWGKRPDGSYLLHFNIAAWKSISFFAESAYSDAQEAIINLIAKIMIVTQIDESGEISKYDANIPKLKFEWMAHSDEAILIFHGETFEIFCRCVELPEQTAQDLLLQAIAEQLMMPSHDFESQGNA